MQRLNGRWNATETSDRKATAHSTRWRHQQQRERATRSRNNNNKKDDAAAATYNKDKSTRDLPRRTPEQSSRSLRTRQQGKNSSNDEVVLGENSSDDAYDDEDNSDTGSIMPMSLQNLAK